MKNSVNKNNPAWQKVLLSRQRHRPQAQDYIDHLFDSFIELHGDRVGGDDPALIGGIATLDGIPVTIIAQQKGHSIAEIKKRKNGMVSPEGYRKSQRLMAQAQKFKRPIITFVDTPGAFAGIGAEEKGQASAIATSLFAMANLKVPVLTIIINQGGSGGALAIAVANEIWMLENAYYSILAPEGFATILWKNSKRAPEAAAMMKSTATDLLAMGLIDKIIQEPKKGLTATSLRFFINLRQEISIFLKKNKSGNYQKKHRFKKFAQFGQIKKQL